jgi:hypothetical protein
MKAIDANNKHTDILIIFLFSDLVDKRNNDNPATEYGAILPSG